MTSVGDPLLAITLVLMLVGLIGSVLPGLPGVPLIFLSALVYAIATDFRTVGVAILAVLFVLAAIALVADFVATSYGARRFGASNWGTAGGAIGGIAGALIGVLFLGIGSLLGLILGTIAGVFIGEYLKRNRQGKRGERGPTGADWQRVSRAAGGVLVGYVASAVAQGLLGLASLIIFLLAVF
jgi:uncharacterized protein YqgC (DUF456 family)